MKSPAAGGGGCSLSGRYHLARGGVRQQCALSFILSIDSSLPCVADGVCRNVVRYAQQLLNQQHAVCRNKGQQASAAV